jgi:hypothetical protein
MRVQFRQDQTPEICACCAEAEDVHGSVLDRLRSARHSVLESHSCICTSKNLQVLRLGISYLPDQGQRWVDIGNCMKRRCIL